MTDFEIVDEGKHPQGASFAGRHADRDWPATRDPSPAKSPPAGDETRRDCSVVARASRPFGHLHGELTWAWANPLSHSMTTITPRQRSGSVIGHG